MQRKSQAPELAAEQQHAPHTCPHGTHSPSRPSPRVVLVRSADAPGQARQAVPGAGSGPHAAQQRHVCRGGGRGCGGRGQPPGEPRRGGGCQPASGAAPAVQDRCHQGVRTIAPCSVTSASSSRSFSSSCCCCTANSAVGGSSSVHTIHPAGWALMQMWTKLRPGVRQFLQRASQYFQLWIHTNGVCVSGRVRGSAKAASGCCCCALGEMSDACSPSWFPPPPAPPCHPPQAIACTPSAWRSCWTPRASTLEGAIIKRRRGRGALLPRARPTPTRWCPTRPRR